MEAKTQFAVWRLKVRLRRIMKIAVTHVVIAFFKVYNYFEAEQIIVVYGVST